MESDREILEKHLNELYKTSKDGDKVVHALRRMLDLLDNNIWISTNIDLMIAVSDKQLSVYQHGAKIQRIESVKFNYNQEEVPTIEIKQQIM